VSEECSWSPEDDSCGLSDETLGSLGSLLIEEAGGDLDDPVCALLDQSVGNGCDCIDYKDKCLESKAFS